MKFTDNTQELKSFLKTERNNGKIIGFVPTMGALHMGHSSLIKKARAQCDIVVCSIFVNPTQFNQAKDLEKYPITLEADKALIEEFCDYLYSPASVKEVYGEEIVLKEFDFVGLENELEGEFRPGHFQGMANVVSLLFEIVEPNKAYFGLKDYQQFTIVTKLVELMNVEIEIVGCDIIRENNGLARSSRNELLTENGREVSSVISYALNYIKLYHSSFSVTEITDIAKSMIEGILDVEYLEVRDAKTLKEVKDWNNVNGNFVSFAGMIDGVRLIDNIRF